MEKFKMALNVEINLLNKKLRKLHTERMFDGAYIHIWTAVFTGQIESYERILEALDDKDGYSGTPN